MCSYCSISPAWRGFAFRDCKPNIKFFLDQEDASPVESSLNIFHLWRVALYSRSPCATVTLGESLLRTKSRTVHTATKITFIWTNDVIHCLHAPKITVIWINKVILFFTICSIISYLVTGHVKELGKKALQKMNTESCNEELLCVTKSKELGCYGCIYMYTILSTLLWLNLGRIVSCCFEIMMS